MLDLTWLVCDLVTGQVIAELPLNNQGIVARTIGKEDSQSFELPWAAPDCPDDWELIVTPGKTMIVLTIDHLPVQAWPIIDVEAGGDTIPITCATLEHLAARTNVPDVDAGLDESLYGAAVAAPLISSFGFTFDITANGRISDLYTDALEDRAILDALTTLQAAETAPEWRMFVRWLAGSNQQRIEKVLQIAPRVGSDRPDIVFDLDQHGRGNIASYRRKTSYAAGKGGTRWIGTSEGIGASRPMFGPVDSPVLAQGWPIWNTRVNFTGMPTASVDDEDTDLARRTIAASIRRQTGTKTWTIVGEQTAPRPGVDFQEGDTVRVDISPQGKRDPTGGTGPFRALGWELDLNSGQVTLIAWDEEGGGS